MQPPNTISNMNNFKLKNLLKPHSRNSKRQELEVSLPFVFFFSAIWTLAIYGILIPFRTTPLGIFMYERGFTQYLVIALSGMVLAITALKYFKLKYESRALRKIWIAEHIPLEKPDSPDVAYFRDRLAKDGSLVALRCSRVLDAYINSGDRAAATEFALDDSSFYLSTSESSYSFPRILVWAIPLLGFLGTVLGISQAVGGFTGVLEQAEDVEKIKEGITSVTTGLAVAFDTTLLALCFSILLMIPLVLIERYETRLLLGIDIFINDKLLPRLKEKNKDINVDTINQAVKGAIDQYFPNPEALIEPAQMYAQKAAQALAQGFIEQISQVQDVSSQIIQQVGEVRSLANSDRQEFMNFFHQQQQANQELITGMKATIEEIKANQESIAIGLNSQASEISQTLEKAAQALENRVANLEQAANKIAQLQQFQQSLDNSLQSMEKTAQLGEVLTGVRDHLAQLQPILKEMNKPRKIILLENENGTIPI
ncbi:hypothetical protein Sta7437_2383 [Stanieria cyanosphaera PCC 7437]|uniref:MotA/TolQ/ExbB proton channel domain-containing protein n=2 Tax=Stanieria cyanosphaera TaxID=102116 RepID=K9XTQ6_STAC7|nr:hypothetical protein Sta7437_2383 [Stanieria cyanosphaera PCC 7437]